MGSFMTELKMSLTQIQEIFTKSELAIMAWSSQEQVADLEKKGPKTRTRSKKSFLKDRKSPEQRLAEELTGEEEEEYSPEVEQQPSGLPNKYYNEDGELDLSKVTGREAVRYLGAMGIHFLPNMRSTFK